MAAKSPLNKGSNSRDKRLDNNYRCDFRNNVGGCSFKGRIVNNNDD